MFHGGSGSTKAGIRETIDYGVIKMNIDTDMQWAFWEGIKNFYVDKKDYLQGQLGNPEGSDAPNKKYYDPRVWLRKGEENFIKRLTGAFENFNNGERGKSIFDSRSGRAYAPNLNLITAMRLGQ